MDGVGVTEHYQDNDSYLTPSHSTVNKPRRRNRCRRVVRNTDTNGGDDPRSERERPANTEKFVRDAKWHTTRRHRRQEQKWAWLIEAFQTFESCDIAIPVASSSESPYLETPGTPGDWTVVDTPAVPTEKSWWLRVISKFLTHTS